MDDRLRHQVAIGTGLGLAVVAYFLPTLVPTMPQSVAIVGVAVGVGLFLWGLWPLVAPRLGASRLIPIKDAARSVLEDCEGTAFGRWVNHTMGRKSIGYYINCFHSHGYTLYGKEGDSSKLRAIPGHKMSSMFFRNDDNNLFMLGDKSEPVFSDVSVERRAAKGLGKQLARSEPPTRTD